MSFEDGWAEGLDHVVSLKIQMGESSIHEKTQSSFDVSTLKSMPNLRRLDITRLALIGLVSGSFKENTKLRSLVLNRTYLGSIPTGAFVHLKHLEKLDLSENFFEKLTPGAFIGLSRLKNLELGADRIPLLESAAFAGLPKLETLKLAYWGHRIEPDFFLQLPSLKTLDVRGVPVAWENFKRSGLLKLDLLIIDPAQIGLIGDALKDIQVKVLDPGCRNEGDTTSIPGVSLIKSVETCNYDH